MASRINNVSSPDAQAISKKVEDLTARANKDKGVKAAELRQLKQEVDTLGYGATNAGGKSISARLDHLATMAEAQESGKPLKNSDKEWAAEMTALSQMNDATVFATHALDAKATANDVKVGGEQVAAAAGNGSNDHSVVPKLHADANSKDPAKNNVTALADKAYVDKLNDPNASTADIGQAQRNAMLAFQVQYPKASLAEFQEHMKYTIGTSTADDNRKTSVTAAVSNASYSDIAANAK